LYIPTPPPAREGRSAEEKQEGELLENAPGRGRAATPWARISNPPPPPPLPTRSRVESRCARGKAEGLDWESGSVLTGGLRQRDGARRRGIQRRRGVPRRRSGGTAQGNGPRHAAVGWTRETSAMIFLCFSTSSTLLPFFFSR
jgi:hypothetical protein